MERKENDLMMNVVANPSFSLEDFATIGFNIDNTSIQDKSVYRNNPLIQKKFSDEDGKFNEKLFNDYYNKALIDYNKMAEDSYNNEIEVSFHRDNIWAPKEDRRTGPEFRQSVVANPDKVTSSVIRLGEIGPRTKSQDELAQAEKVLLNPVEAEDDWSKAKWGTTPNDGFLDYFFEPLVMAAYDEDGTHIDPITGETVQHKKGELKVGPNGTYYYERLDGRDVYGRRVLNKMNVLTDDGSTLNKYDFFDSDDIEQKSIGGSLLKQAVLVGSMFIPYIGPVIAGASILTQLVGLTGTLGKMLTGSDSPTFSAMEGWSKSMNRQTAKTEYAQNNTWCWENFITMIGDVAGQLKEQRFFFEKVPALFKGGINTKAGRDKLLKGFTEAEDKIAKAKVSELIATQDVKNLQGLRAKYTDIVKANADKTLNKWIESYNDLGGNLSKAYMTAITVGDTYGEAKLAGASDLDATLLTLGYAAGEYAILNTGIGEWILPELRAQRYQNKALLHAAINDVKETSKNIAKQFGTAITNIPKEGKKEWAKNVFNIGKNLANATYANGSRKGAGLLKASLAGGLGEGVEEVSEEVLADFSKGCYNTVNWLRGNDVRMNSFGFSWKDGNRTFNAKDIFDRYSLSFVGGLAGGALTNLGTTYQMLNTEFTPESARQQLVYMAREGKLGEIRKQLEKETIGNKHLSATQFETIDGKTIPKAGTETDNQDVYAKKIINQYLDFIENTIKAEGSPLPDDAFLQSAFKDLRFSELYRSQTAGRMLQDYNTLNSDILGIVADINAQRAKLKDANKDGATSDTENRSAEADASTQKRIDELNKQLTDKQKELKDLAEGKNADKYVGEALFEMTPELHKDLLAISFPLFVHSRFNGRNFSELSDVEKGAAQTAFKAWADFDKKDKIHTVASLFMDMLGKVGTTLSNQNTSFAQYNQKTDELIQKLTSIYDTFTFAENLDVDVATKFLSNSGRLEQVAAILDPEALTDATNVAKAKIGLIDTNLSQDQQIVQRKPIDDEYISKVRQIIKDNINPILDDFINHGYVNVDIQKNLAPLVTYLRNGVYDYNTMQQDNEQAKADGEDTPYTDEQIQEAKVNTKRIDKFLALSNSPMEKMLDEFASDVSDDPIKASQVIAKVQDILKVNSGDLSQSNISDDLIRQVDNVVKLIDLYQSALHASKVDNTNLENVYGYTKTVNEVSKKLGKDANLPEIDTKFANRLIGDLDNARGLLTFFRNLYNANNGNKLVQQDKVAQHTYSLIYSKLRNIVQVPPDDDSLLQIPAYQAFKSLIEDQNEFQVLKAISENGNESLDSKQKLELVKEMAILDDAIYDLFQDDAFKTSEGLQKFFNVGRFNIYQAEPDFALNKNLKELTDSQMLCYIAARAAVKMSDFMAAYKELIDPQGKIAPITPQELAVFQCFASVMNGQKISDIVDAYNNSIEQDWGNSNIDQRREKLKNLVSDPQLLEELIKDENKAEALSGLYRMYNTIALVEGIAGSGKTSAVFSITKQMLEIFAPEVLQNAWIAHGADDKGNPAQAKKIRDALNLNGEIFDKVSLLKKLSPEYHEGDITTADYTISDTGRVQCTWKINETINDLPSILLIDEIGKFNAIELSLIDTAAKKFGITVIAAGDFDQVKNRVTVSKNNKTFNLTLNRRRFVHSPKLGVSMRPDNNLKAYNNNILQWWKNTNLKKQIALQYNTTEDGTLRGDRVFKHSDNMDDIKAQIKKMISTLDTKNGEYIQYIECPGSKLFKLLSTSEFAPYIKRLTYDNMQGREAKYYITDLSDSSKVESEDLIDVLYTGATRAQQGSIIVVDAKLSNITSKEVKEYVDESKIFERQIPTYTRAKKERLDTVFTNTPNIPYIARTKPSQLQPPANPPRTNQSTEADYINKLEQATTPEQLEQVFNGILNIQRTQAVIKAYNDQKAKLATPQQVADYKSRIEQANTFQELLPILNEIKTNNLLGNPQIKEAWDKRSNEIISNYKDITEDLKKQGKNPDTITIQYEGQDITLDLVDIPFINHKNQTRGTTKVLEDSYDKVVIVKIGNDLQLPFVYYSDGSLGGWFFTPGYSNGGIFSSDIDPTLHWNSSLIKAISDALNAANLNSTEVIDNKENSNTTMEIVNYGFNEFLERYQKLTGDPNDDIWNNTIKEQVYNTSQELQKKILSYLKDSKEKRKLELKIEIEAATNLSDLNAMDSSEFDSELRSIYKKKCEELEKKLADRLTVPTIDDEDDSILGDGTDTEIKPVILKDSKPKSDNQIDNDTIHADILLYTFNMSELGAIEDPNGEPEKTDTVTDLRGNTFNALEYRIDSINGLRKIYSLIKPLPPIQLYNNSEKKWALTILDKLRSIIMTESDTNNMLKKISEILDGYECQNITFAIKLNPVISNATKSKGGTYASSHKNVVKYSNNVNEKNYGVSSQHQHSDEIISHKLVAIIGDEVNGDLLEIPLTSLESPITLMNSAKDSNGNLIYAALLTAFNTNGELHERIDNVIKQFGGISKYEEIINLFELFRFQNAGLIKLNYQGSKFADWLPSKNLKNLGLLFSSNWGKYSEDQGWTDESLSVSPMDLTDFVVNSNMTVSKILVSPEGNSGFGIPAGHPFIIVGTSDLRETQLVDYWKQQQNQGTEESKNPKTKLLWVTPPKSNIADYIRSISNKLNHHAEKRDIGHLYTPFQVLNILLQDKDILSKLAKGGYEYNGNTKAIDNLKSLVKEFMVIYNDSTLDQKTKQKRIKEKLWSDVEIIGAKTKAINILSDALFRIARNQDINDPNYVALQFDDNTLNQMQELLDAANYSIYYRSNKITVNAQTQNEFTEVEQDNYTIDGKSYTISGTVISPTFKGNMANIIKYAVDRIKAIQQGKKFKDKNGNKKNIEFDYYKPSTKAIKRTTVPEIKPNDKVTQLLANIQYAKDKLEIVISTDDIDIAKYNKSEQQITNKNEELINEILKKDPNIIPLFIDGRLICFDSEENVPIPKITVNGNDNHQLSLDLTTGKYKGVIKDSNGNEYGVSYSESEKKLIVDQILPAQSQPTVQPISIKFDEDVVLTIADRWENEVPRGQNLKETGMHSIILDILKSPNPEETLMEKAKPIEGLLTILESKINHYEGLGNVNEEEIDLLNTIFKILSTPKKDRGNRTAEENTTCAKSITYKLIE